jgi:transposase-like protein
MARHRTHSLELKRQAAQEYLSGEASLHGLAKRHDIARNLIRIWVEKYEAGTFDDDQVLAGTLEPYEAKIALRFFKRQLSLPVSDVAGLSSAVVILASPNTDGHSAKVNDDRGSLVEVPSTNTALSCWARKALVATSRTSLVEWRADELEVSQLLGQRQLGDCDVVLD